VSTWRTEATTAKVTASGSRARPAAPWPTRPLRRAPARPAISPARSGGHPGNSSPIAVAKAAWNSMSCSGAARLLPQPAVVPGTRHPRVVRYPGAPRRDAHSGTFRKLPARACRGRIPRRS
jgi:hypothetical protein